MSWLVEYTNEFDRWWDRLEPKYRTDVAAVVEMLEEDGPHLRFPFSSGVNRSRHSKMRELRIQSHGKQIRVLYAFDPRRAAVLLIGGTKASGKSFYKRLLPQADKLYDQHLEELRQEGAIR